MRAEPWGVHSSHLCWRYEVPWGAAEAAVSAGAVPEACVCSFEDGLKLVKLRGESMQAAADASKSGMTSVIGLSSDKVSCLH